MCTRVGYSNGGDARISSALVEVAFASAATTAPKSSDVHTHSAAVLTARARPEKSVISLKLDTPQSNTELSDLSLPERRWRGALDDQHDTDRRPLKVRAHVHHCHNGSSFLPPSCLRPFPSPLVDAATYTFWVACSFNVVRKVSAMTVQNVITRRHAVAGSEVWIVFGAGALVVYVVDAHVGRWEDAGPCSAYRDLTQIESDIPLMFGKCLNT
ncbi:hypothetical protein C8J57DRAFT_1231266 [Mycena rebaudengoi]|nr:hypothetical protein C8J57DRAFT_1231266 [Mycena rebaudengoi]